MAQTAYSSMGTITLFNYGCRMAEWYVAAIYHKLTVPASAADTLAASGVISNQISALNPAPAGGRFQNTKLEGRK